MMIRKENNLKDLPLCICRVEEALAMPRSFLAVQ